MILTILAWAATASVLFTYAWSVRHPDKAAAFHWANALGFLPLAALNATLHAWPSVAINFGFGIPACYAVLREISRRRTERYNAQVWAARIRECQDKNRGGLLYVNGRTHPVHPQAALAKWNAEADRYLVDL